MKAVWLAIIGTACIRHSPPSQLPPIWIARSITAETTPAIPLNCQQDSFPTALFLQIRRDPLTGRVEWLSGHRYALTTYLEQLSVPLLIIETPWEDTLFFPRDSAAWTIWRAELAAWLREELLPFLRPYPVRWIAFGRSWLHSPLSPAEWDTLLQGVSQEDSTRYWGICASRPELVPSPSQWHFIGIDYQHFYPPAGHAPYQANWESLHKPLIVIYPNLFEPDKHTALIERSRYWHTPPLAIVVDTLACP